MIAIVDYGAGNLFSVKNALEYIGEKSLITRKISDLENCDRIILPGVGAFPDAMAKLRSLDLVGKLRELAQQKPFIGICLGMQMLFSKGHEFTECEGLNLIPGTVEKIESQKVKIPHMGWNSLNINLNCPILDNRDCGEFVYFVHSYMVKSEEKYIAAWVEHDLKIPAVVQRGTVLGTQFHPEKSGDFGIKMLKRFCEYR